MSAVDPINSAQNVKIVNVRMCVPRYAIFLMCVNACVRACAVHCAIVNKKTKKKKKIEKYFHFVLF